MAETAHTSMLADKSQEIVRPERRCMIKVEDVAMDFNVANQQLNSLKEYFIAVARRQLMFKRFRALDGISIEVQQGDVYGIMGTNGSGKSTLLKIISGVLDPTEGTVSIAGNIAPLIELGAGFDPELTARENIYLNGSLLGYSKKFIDKHFDEIVEFSEVGDFLDMPIKNYSSGMVSRIAFAIATVIVPEILIVDEVLSVGDFMFRQKCERRIQQLIEEHGTTVLIVSHSSEQIERLCNKAIWVEKGHTRIVGSAKEVSRAYQALAGHSGTEESERFLFDVLDDGSPAATESVSRIRGRDSYAVNAALMDLLPAGDERGTVVVAPGYDLSAYLIALNLASALGCPCLMAKPDEFPDAGVATLARMAPRHVVVIDHDGFTPMFFESLKRLLSDDVEVEILASGTHDGLSEKVFERMRAFGAFSGDTAVLAGNGGFRSAALIGTYLCAHPSPLFFNVDGALDADCLKGQLDGLGIRRVVCLGRFDESGRALIERLAHDGFGVDEGLVCDDAWIEEDILSLTRSGEQATCSSKSLYVFPPAEPFNVLSAAPLAAMEDATPVFVDHDDLDQMRDLVQLMLDSGNTLRTVRVIGIDTSFGGVDAYTFAKAIGKAAYGAEADDA